MTERVTLGRLSSPVSVAGVEVLLARIEGMERMLAEQTSRAHRAEMLFEAAAAYLRYNADRFRPARGPDEARMLAAAEQLTGPLRTGRTDGWVGDPWEQLEMFGRD